MVAFDFVTPDEAPNRAAAAEVIKRCQDERVLLVAYGASDQAIRVIPPLVVDAG